MKNYKKILLVSILSIVFLIFLALIFVVFRILFGIYYGKFAQEVREICRDKNEQIFLAVIDQLPGKFQSNGFVFVDDYVHYNDWSCSISNNVVALDNQREDSQILFSFRKYANNLELIDGYYDNSRYERLYFEDNTYIFKNEELYKYIYKFNEQHVLEITFDQILFAEESDEEVIEYLLKINDLDLEEINDVNKHWINKFPLLTGRKSIQINIKDDPYFAW